MLLEMQFKSYPLTPSFFFCADFHTWPQQNTGGERYYSRILREREREYSRILIGEKERGRIPRERGREYSLVLIAFSYFLIFYKRHVVNE